MIWDRDALERAIRTLGRHTTVAAAALELGAIRQTLESAFARKGLGRPATYLASPDDDPPTERWASSKHYETVVNQGNYDPEDKHWIDAHTPSGDPPPTLRSQREPGADRASIETLIGLTRKAPLDLDAACEALKCGPRRVRELVEAARAQGYHLDATGTLIGRRPQEDTSEAAVPIAPVRGERYRVGVISDLHFGSKHHGTDQLRDTLNIMRDAGITTVLNPGDTLDGCYKHSMWEQSHHGFDEQAEHAYETFRLFPELSFHCIDGNHDETFSDAMGIACGRMLSERFAANGLRNWHHHGGRAALLSMGEAKVMLWHPRGSGAYALSYKLQKKVEGFAPGQKPDILLTGHYHQACYIVERGVHAFLCPTFQLPGGNFGNSLCGSPSVGGMLLSWQTTEERTLRRFSVERLSYYAGETAREIQ